jgi:hypothetical protein
VEEEEWELRAEDDGSLAASGRMPNLTPMLDPQPRGPTVSNTRGPNFPSHQYQSYAPLPTATPANGMVRYGIFHGEWCQAVPTKPTGALASGLPVGALAREAWRLSVKTMPQPRGSSGRRNTTSNVKRQAPPQLLVYDIRVYLATLKPIPAPA